jgi:hypothetical protein
MRFLKPLLLAGAIFSAAAFGSLAAHADPIDTASLAEIVTPGLPGDDAKPLDFAALSDAIPEDIAGFAEELIKSIDDE